MNRKIFNDLADYIMDTYDVNIIDKKDISFEELVNHIDSIVVGEYFGSTGVGGNYWKPDNNWQYKRTGMMLVERLREYEFDTWLDVGCGQNQYKRYFPDKVTGIDPYNEAADIMVDVMSYEAPHQYDIVTVMGSINFGDRSVIEPQVEKAVSFVKPGGKMFWRCNPGITHDDPNNKARWIDFFEWSPEIIIEFADKFGCTVDEIDWDNNKPKAEIRYGNRHYSEWTKK